jgi:hypothetical protein
MELLGEFAGRKDINDPLAAINEQVNGPQVHFTHSRKLASARELGYGDLNGLAGRVVV